MVDKKNQRQYKCWRLNVPFMLKEVAPTTSNIAIAWYACKSTDLFLIKLTGSTPPLRRNKHG